MPGRNTIESSFIEEFEKIYHENEFDVEEEELVEDAFYVEPDEEEDPFDDYWEGDDEL